MQSCEFALARVAAALQVVRLRLAPGSRHRRLLSRAHAPTLARNLLAAVWSSTIGRVRTALLFALAACAHERYVISPPEEIDDPAAHLAFRAADLAGYEAAFRLTWNGERIGDARERFVRDGDGWRFERNERIQVLRSGALATARTRVTIAVDDVLVPRRIDVERETGPARAAGRAVRLRDGSWQIVDDGAAV